ncbi:uncharacterized protein F4822DRAFT_199912 [Hypoxylon trugodes]|uniref:uncharacterized protein n=1 Tax=Hypoxylon trugodes TaxID=326681 RepID=UPI0021A0E01F|nr:uncharacterized protein F4822DRAFT_199912 [Hypoxylon trugodes]KAI1389432.1 hypothetical protein F4822DRAFT_199912 [Hypoxylon trugodes]
MTASTQTALPAASTALYFEPLHDRPTLGKPSQHSFKKHKVLPHPRNNRPLSITKNRHSRDLSIDTTQIPESHVKADEPSTPPNPKHDDSPNVKAPGPALPPTPPAHSRTSSGSHSIQPSSPTYIGTPVQSATNISAHSTPRTPPHQASPPTPDVTPPQPERRSIPPRPILADRIPSKATDSRTESFTTARENLDSSEEDDKLSTPKAVLSSGRATQNLGRRVIDARQKKAASLGLGLALESDDNLTPRSKREFSAFDGEWGSASEVDQEWDNKYERNVKVEKRRVQPTTNGQKLEVVEDEMVTPTNATKAVRSAPLSDRLHTQPSPPPESVSRDKRWAAPSTSESSVSIDVRRSSGMSSKSTVSTVVEAILVGTPPQRRKTLRHVRKQTALRDSSSEISPSSSSANTSLRQVENVQGTRAPRRLDGTARSESLASTGTMNSIASRKARREVWKNGGIPVVVIPDRRASIKATDPPSLRSTSSHRSKRSNSLSSAPISSHSKARDLTPYFDKPSRRDRSMSVSDKAVQVEELTMDFPPIVPLRRSSLSAPTSRNGSRAGSLTAESLKAHNTFLEQESKQQHQQQPQHRPPHVTVECAPPVEDMNSSSDQRQVKPAPSVESHKDALHDHRPLVDNNGDPFFGKRLTAHNTPFSQASVETNGTHSVADISEAMAVNIYPHQNKSVLMVHHMSKPVDPAVAANALQGPEPAQTGDGTETEKFSNNPKITASSPDGAPATPPQPQFSMDDVDSPLRNPRAPPEPPAIKFIPATPSGLTPAAEKEKMLGNYFEESQKRPSLVRRAFSLRKSTDNVRPTGFLSRTLSLSKGIRKETAENPALDKSKDAKLHQYPTAEDPPPDESKLHPFWRPAFEDEFDNYDDWAHDIPAEVDGLYMYPPAGDHRPTRRRSLSERMRRTFAILPIDNEDHYTSFDRRSPERRTVKRTPSGRLRVMRHRDSYGSLEWNGHWQSEDYDTDERPSTAPDNPNRRAWGVEKRVDDRGRRLFPNWQDKLDQYRPQNLQRRLSEHRRQKRTDALRQKISGPREVRDGVGEVIKRNSYKGPSYQTMSNGHAASNGRAYRQQPEGQPRRETVRA